MLRLGSVSMSILQVGGSSHAALTPPTLDRNKTFRPDCISDFLFYHSQELPPSKENNTEKTIPTADEDPSIDDNTIIDEETNLTESVNWLDFEISLWEGRNLPLIQSKGKRLPPGMIFEFMYYWNRQKSF